MIGDLIAGLFGKVLDKAWPDANQKAEMALKLAEMQQAGEFKAIDAALQMAQGQMDINKAEASSGDPFASRWRPFIGWVCGMAFGWNFIGLPVALFACSVAGHPMTFAPADMAQMMPVLIGLLGLGGYRSFDKAKGTA